MQWPWDAFKDEKWLDVLSYQSGHGDDSSTLAWIHSGPPAKKARRAREAADKPRASVRRPPAYQSRKPHPTIVCAGPPIGAFNAPMAGLTYGAHGIWSWQTSAGELLAHKGTGQAKLWRDAMNLPGSAQMGHIVKILGAPPRWALKPAQDMLMRQPGAEDPSRSLPRADRGRSPLRALSPRWRRDRSQSRHLREQLPAFWVDPRTGRQRVHLA